ncbi:hypothetical protein B7463_g8044, partial [Scytalidium lignicola]
MVSFATPSPKKGQPQSPIVRSKSASPWRVTRTSSYLPRNPLNLRFGTVTLRAPIPNPLYEASSSDTQNNLEQRPEKVIRLTLPFSLRNNGIPRGPTEAELPELQKHFPTLRNVSYQHPFLVLRVEKLPEQPWPTILADLPLWLTTTSNEPPLEIGQLARASQRFTVKGDIQHYKTPNEATVLEIIELVNKRGAGVDRIRWDGCMFRAFGDQEPIQGWQNRLPARINGFSICYFWTKSPLEEHALRMKAPAVNVTDDTEYRREQLRPGIMISGFHNNMKEGLGTTSGACVESPTSGKKFITVAAHGFPAGVGDFVYHPRVCLSNGLPDARYQIAPIDKKFGNTDIALAQLQPGIQYSGETFSDPEPGQPQAQPFRRLKDPETLNVYDPVFMNTPVNGQCEGLHIGTEWALGFEASDEAPQQSKSHCEIAHFSYWGNGSDIFFRRLLWGCDLG